MSVHDQAAFIALLRSTRCADDALLCVAVQPLYELLDLAVCTVLGSAETPRTSVPPKAP